MLNFTILVLKKRKIYFSYIKKDGFRTYKKITGQTGELIVGKSLSDLARILDNKVDAIKEAASDAAVKTAVTVVSDLAFKTPVDTSDAISNWQTELNTPASGERNPYFTGSRGSTQLASANATIQNAKAKLVGKKPDQDIFISNLLPYIADLNNGTSAQAPAGFVERAILIGRKSAKRNFKVK